MWYKNGSVLENCVIIKWSKLAWPPNPIVVSNVDGNISEINWNKFEKGQIKSIFEQNGNVYLIDENGKMAEISENYVTKQEPIKSLAGNIEFCVRSDSAEFIIIKNKSGLFLCSGEKSELILIDPS